MKGYKAFYKGLINKNGFQFEEGKTYSIGGKVEYGEKGNGYHFCKRLEDTLRYFSEEEDIEFAEVTSLGELAEYHDHYFGFFNMYCTNKLRIDRVLTREEVINMFLEMNGYRNERLNRFLSLFPLTSEEIILFKNKFKDEKDIIDIIFYYQENNKDIPEKQYSIGNNKKASN